MSHSLFVYDTTLHVPLILRGEGAAGGRRVATTVGIADVAATVLARVGGAGPSLPGRDLLSPGLEPAPLYAETLAPRLDFGWSDLRSWRDGRYSSSALRAPSCTTWPPTRASRGSRRRGAGGRPQDGPRPRRRSGGVGEKESRRAPDPEAAERLRSLGYVQGPGGRGSGADPKDKVDVARRIAAAAGPFPDHAAAARAYREIAALDPDNPLVNFRLADALLRAGKPGEAVGYFRRVVSSGPRTAEAHVGLATAYADLGRLDEAEKAPAARPGDRRGERTDPLQPGRDRAGGGRPRARARRVRPGPRRSRDAATAQRRGWTPCNEAMRRRSTLAAFLAAVAMPALFFFFVLRKPASGGPRRQRPSRDHRHAARRPRRPLRRPWRGDTPPGRPGRPRARLRGGAVVGAADAAVPRDDPERPPSRPITACATTGPTCSRPTAARSPRSSSHGAMRRERSSEPTSSTAASASAAASTRTTTASSAGAKARSVLESERRGEAVVEAATAWIAGRTGPFFAWVHLYDPHAPYDPPPPYRETYAGRLYDGEIAYADACLGRLLAAAEARAGGRLLVAVVSDHGEGARRARREDPWLLRLPVDASRALRARGTGDPREAPPGSGAHRRCDAHDPEPSRPRSSRGPRRRRSAGRWSREGSLRGDVLPGLPGLVAAPRVAAGELEARRGAAPGALRPGERSRRDARPLRGAAPGGDPAAQRPQCLHEGRVEDGRGDGPRRSDGAPPRARLRDRGPGGTGESPQLLKDPKDVLALWQAFENAIWAEARGDREAAVAGLRELVAKEPAKRCLPPQPGGRRCEGPAAAARRSTSSPWWSRWRPATPWRGMSAASVLAEAGRIDEAMRAEREAIRLAPSLPEPHSHLGILLAGQGRVDEALAAFDEAIRLDPNNARAWNNRANVLRGKGRREEAAEAYRTSARLAPRDPDPVNGLGVLAVEAGDLDGAAALFSAGPRARSRPLRRGPQPRLRRGAPGPRGRGRAEAPARSSSRPLDPSLSHRARALLQELERASGAPLRKIGFASGRMDFREG